jgi:hypothetical protein
LASAQSQENPKPEIRNWRKIRISKSETIPKSEPPTKEKPNPRFEYRNPKQYRITKQENLKPERFPVSDFGSDFRIVSDFGIRISDFPPTIPSKPGPARTGWGDCYAGATRARRSRVAHWNGKEWSP